MAAGLGLVVRTAAAALRPGAPPYLIFFVTDRCPGRCSFCFNRDRAEQARPDDELTLAEIQAIASKWPGLIQVTLTGGEPFVREDLGGIARAFIAAGAPSLTIASNGLFPDRVVTTVSSLLADHPRLHLDLDLSVDGPAEVHDRLRGLPGAHHKVMQTARDLAPLMDRHPGFRVGATLTVSAGNRDTAVATLRELAGSGVFMRVQALRVRGRTFDPAAGSGDLSAYEDACEFLGSVHASRGLGRVREDLSSLVREDVMSTAAGTGEGRPCLAGRTMVTIDPYGAVRPCEMLDQLLPDGAPDGSLRDWRLGSLREEDYAIARVMKSKAAVETGRWIRESRCRCSFECAAYNNLVFSPRAWPRVLGRVLGRGR